MGLCAVASYYGFDFPCPTNAAVCFLPWLVDFVAQWAAADGGLGPSRGAERLGGASPSDAP
jgi:hypothetical protein